MTSLSPQTPTRTHIHIDKPPPLYTHTPLFIRTHGLNCLCRPQAPMSEKAGRWLIKVVHNSIKAMTKRHKNNMPQPQTTDSRQGQRQRKKDKRDRETKTTKHHNQHTRTSTTQNSQDNLHESKSKATNKVMFEVGGRVQAVGTSQAAALSIKEVAFTRAQCRQQPHCQRWQQAAGHAQRLPTQAR